MADTQSKLRQQHAHASNALNYGHLGTATYIEKSRKWAFIRRNVETPREDSIDPDYHPPPAAFPFEQVEDAAKLIFHGDQLEDSKKVQYQNAKPLSSIHRFLGSFPEVVPAGALLNEKDAPLSRLCDAFDHKQNDCLAFGGAAMIVDTGKSRRTIPIAALTAGGNAESVKLLCVGKEAVGLEDVEGSRCTYWVPTISYEEEAWWTGSGEEVLQICFAASWDHKTVQSTWMAVRQQSCTTIFHPLFHRVAVSAQSARPRPSFKNHPPSKLDANPILSLPISRTGGHSHADVQFHPQDHRSLAVVDEHGNWSVWKIDGKNATTRRVTYTIKLRHAGNLSSWDEIKPSLTTPIYHDGWHRVCWLNHSAHETDRLLVCNRITVCVYDSLGEKLGPVDPRLGSSNHNQWLLDIKRSATNPSYCYLLTSTRLMLMSASNKDWADPAGLESLALILSWHHFRSRSDSSLRIKLLETARSTTIVVSSDENAIITVFRIGLFFEDLSTPVSLADPAQLNLQLDTDLPNRESAKILDFRDLQVQRQPEDPKGLLNPVLFKLFLRRTDSQIQEVLYRCTEREISGTFNQPYSTAIALPSLRAVRAKLQAVHKRSKRYADLEDLSEFVVSDDIELGTDGNFVWSNAFRDLKADRNNKSNNNRTTFDWEDIYNLLESERINPILQPRTELKTLLLDLQQSLDQSPPENLQTLHGLINAVPYIGEAEAGSSILHAFIDQNQSRLGLQMSVLDLPGHHSGGHHDVLLSFYNKLTIAWLRSLPLTTSDRERVSKERLCRAVAADLALASVIVRPTLPKILDSKQEIQSPEAATDPQSFPLPFPPAVLPSSSHESSSQTPTTENQAITRLRVFTKITNSIPLISTSASKTLTSILAHLPTDPTVDPATYDYRATEARLIAGKEETLGNAKARRHAERIAHQQRRRIEVQRLMSQALREQEADGGIPGVFSSSQMPREVQSSRAGPATQGGDGSAGGGGSPRVMTQPERGLFGMRSAVGGAKGRKGKGKERKQGF